MQQTVSLFDDFIGTHWRFDLDGSATASARDGALDLAGVAGSVPLQTMVVASDFGGEIYLCDGCQRLNLPAARCD